VACLVVVSLAGLPITAALAAGGTVGSSTPSAFATLQSLRSACMLYIPLAAMAVALVPPLRRVLLRLCQLVHTSATRCAQHLLGVRAHSNRGHWE
jgi:hypothetical protein